MGLSLLKYRNFDNIEITHNEMADQLNIELTCLSVIRDILGNCNTDELARMRIT